MNLISMLVNPKSWLPQTKMGQNIPKIIHQTFPNKNLPFELQENINHIKKINPDWEYRLYDDTDIENFIKRNYPQLFKFYKKINPKYGAAKADFFRYLVMYKEGGLYLDIKSSLSKPLKQVIQPSDKIVLSYWSNQKNKKHANWGIHEEPKNSHGEFQQWFSLAVPGHPFLHTVISQVVENILKYDEGKYHDRRKDVLCLTGPIAFTLAIEPLISKYPNRLSQNGELGFIYSIYENSNTKRHTTLFKAHYSTLQEPVISNIKSLIKYNLRRLFLSLPTNIQNWIRQTFTT